MFHSFTSQELNAEYDLETQGQAAVTGLGLSEKE